MKNPAINIIIAAGGTGGHLFPGIAIAQTFSEKNSENKILFTGSGKSFEKTVLKRAGYNHETIKSEGIKGYGLFKKIRALMKIPGGIISSSKIIMKFKPDIIIGMGGYSSGPLVIASWLFRKKIVLHEQNMIPGITNRILSFFADKIYVSFQNTMIKIKPEKIVYSGNPVRKELLDKRVDSNVFQMNEFKTPFTILIIGGSQGAHSINMTVIESLKFLKDAHKLSFIHQTGDNDESIVKKAYVDEGIDSIVSSFFYNMDEIYQRADIIICRAGATTIAEITVLGKASIFIPYPYAADNHQVHNAQVLTENNAAEMILENDLNEKVLADKIKFYSQNLKRISEMAKNSKNFGKPEASEIIVNDCYKLLEN